MVSFGFRQRSPKERWGERETATVAGFQSTRFVNVSCWGLLDVKLWLRGVVRGQKVRIARMVRGGDVESVTNDETWSRFLVGVHVLNELDYRITS